MTVYSTLNVDLLGGSDLLGPWVAFVILPSGQLFVVNYVANSTSLPSESTIEILQPGNASINNITASAYTGSIPTDIDSIANPEELFVGSNKLPDIILANGGYDDNTGVGGQLTIFAPDAEGQYVDVTSALPQLLAPNDALSTGVINGNVAIAVNADVSGLPQGLELLIANPSYSCWA